MMKQRFDLLLHTFLSFVQRVPARAAAVVALVVLASATLLTVRPSSLLEAGLATATLPQKADTAQVNATDDTTQAETPEQRFAARVGITHKAIDLNAGTLDTRKITPLPVQKLGTIDRETLWLARCVYSETNRPEEMELVAWTIRNRVETGYRGKRTYESVVLDPWQFSAFNRNSGKRGYFTSLTPQSEEAKWKEALTIAHVVKNAPAKLRPFSKETRHYYSERSMVGKKQPAWAVGETPIAPKRAFQLEAQRFRFYANVS